IQQIQQKQKQMAEDKIKVTTRDGDILEVDLYVAKQWQPVKLIYEERHLVLIFLPQILDDLHSGAQHTILQCQSFQISTNENVHS
ncbi:unnamed protein product, partial [Rotaria magnacalcarata]